MPATRARRAAATVPKPSQVLFASAHVARPEAEASLPAKFARLLKKLDLKGICQDGRVAIKVHLGGGLGYTTIHPIFMRTLVQAVKDAGGKPFLVEGAFWQVESAAARGYTQETIGCPIVAAGGPFDSHVVPAKIGYRSLKEVSLFGAIVDAPAMINFSHVKGHGDCGYGGACKNLAMGCVDQPSRGRIHMLEGGLRWHEERCTFCGRCVKACDTNAISLKPEKRKLSIFWHHCRYCRHCVSACPTNALEMEDGGGFRHFQEGMARITKAVLGTFDPGRVLHINLLANMTMLCDCWGFSSPALLPDIGIMASDDIVALEQACLDAIDADLPLPGSLIGQRTLLPGKHLFERIHGKDPYIQVKALAKQGLGSTRHQRIEVR
jgi:uncharacterized Fe-S center protein